MRWAVALLVLVPSGCVLDDFESGEVYEPLAEEFCDQFLGCECSSPDAGHLLSYHLCARALTDDIRDVERIGESWGLSRDDSCVEEFAQRAAQSNQICDALGNAEACARPCRLYHGDRDEGQACQSTARELSTCRQGLVCNGVCYDPCGAAPTAGDVDGGLLGDGEACSGHTQCASTHCPSGYCLPMPGPGEPCPAGVCLGRLECVDGICDYAAPSVCTLVYP